MSLSPFVGGAGLFERASHQQTDETLAFVSTLAATPIVLCAVTDDHLQDVVDPPRA